MSALHHHPGGGSDHHGALHPLRLRLCDQAAAGGAGVGGQETGQHDSLGC